MDGSYTLPGLRHDPHGRYAGLETISDFFGEQVKEFNDRYQSPLGEYCDLQLVVHIALHSYTYCIAPREA